MITREFKLYLNAGVGVAPVINANQFDQDEEWIFTLLQSDGTVYTPSTGAIIGLKQDGTTILNAGTVNSSGQVVITETEQMTAVPGSNLFEILIDGNTHGTANFVVFVERRPGDIDNPSESDISLFQEAIEAAGNVTQFQADISALQSGLATTNANLTSEANTRASADATLQRAISTEASTRSTQDAVLQAEIDQIIAPSGEAPSAAEVQNARIGVDGTTYDTLGNAIRGQVSDLKNFIDTVYVDESINPVYRTGYIRTNGVFGDDPNLCRTNLISLKTEYVTVAFKTGYIGKIAEYSDNVSSSSFVRFIRAERKSWSVSFVADLTKFYAFDIAEEDGTPVTTSNIPSDAITIIYHYVTDKTLSLSDKPADAKVVGDRINDTKSKIEYSESYSADLWEMGAITVSNGNNTSSTTTIRTIGEIAVSSAMDKFTAINGFEFNVFGWNGSTYIGYWNGSEFKTSGSALSYYSTEKEVSPMRTFGVTHVRIVMRKTSGETPTPSDGVDFNSISLLPLKNLNDIEFLKNALNYNFSPYNHGEYITNKEDYSEYYTGKQSDYSAFGESTVYSEVLSAFDALMNNANGYITKNALGTASGTDSGGNPYTIYEYVFKPKQKTSVYSSKKTPKIYMDGSIHGFEKNSTFGLYYFLKDIVEHWDDVRSLEAIRNSVEFHIIPVSNPYGFDRNEYVNGNGVNINRNFAHPGDWIVVLEPDTEVNGLSAFDQPESAIIRDWLLAGENDILMYFNCHTNGRITTGYAEMNPLMTSNDRNDQYFNKLFDAFIRQINRQTIRLPLMYSLIQPSTSEMCGTITSSPTSNATKGTASTWADTMETMLAMTLEVFNGLKNSVGDTVIVKYSDDSKKICSEMIGNIVINVLLEYSMI